MNRPESLSHVQRLKKLGDQNRAEKADLICAGGKALRKGAKVIGGTEKEESSNPEGMLRALVTESIWLPE